MEAKGFDEVDPVDLDLVHLGPKFNPLNLLATNYRSQVGFGQADQPPFGLGPMIEIGYPSGKLPLPIQGLPAMRLQLPNF